MKPNRLMSGVIILSCLAAVSATGCREGGTIVSSEDRNIPVMKLYPETIEVPRSFVADIQAIQFVEVKSKVGGFIKEIHVDEGQKVSKGDVLFKLDAIEYYEAVREAEAALRDVHGADFTGELVNLAEEIFVYRGEARERPGLKLAWQSGGEERGGFRLADAFFLARELRRVVDAESVFENHCAASSAS